MTVDGDRSTERHAAAVRHRPVRRAEDQSGDDKARRLPRELEAVLMDLAQQAKVDGEGPRKLVKVTVSGAESHASARKTMQSLAQLKKVGDGTGAVLLTARRSIAHINTAICAMRRLADDKHGLEQLINDIRSSILNRVGIFGHSGGAAMSTAAICTYPDFYKVAVASSGNHDNNIYNRTWGKTYQV